jgi:hypothetical protein
MEHQVFNVSASPTPMQDISDAAMDAQARRAAKKVGLIASKNSLARRFNR